MDHFNLRNGVLHAEAVPVPDIVAAHGTPCFIYSRATLTRHYRVFDEALAGLDHLVCYAVKANSNLGVLNVLARLGSGFDIVSVGELERVLEAGGDAAKTVFSGVGKTAAEMERALEVGIKCFNVESLPELERLNAVATAHGVRAPVSLRINPDVDAGTHPYIATGLKDNKFGIDIGDADRAFDLARDLPALDIFGLDCHIGSQLTTLPPFIDALDRLLVLLDRLAERGIAIRHLDLGGGLGIRYQAEEPPLPQAYAEAIRDKLADRGLEILIEPGRAIAGNAGILVTRVEFLKQQPEKRFAIVDAAMNDLIRPTLYNAWQNIVPVQPRDDIPMHRYDIVGPVCESGDWLGRDRDLAIAAGDLLAVRSAGAYGFTMSSNYNSRPRAAEVMVDDDQVHLVRAREALTDLWRGELVLPA
ncbi:diaminopimelate decarboxylase [uncultured Abyssibacter sp.]|uniref:diaminopimelate decarboxylase n=1 Tax=uncultured Abyssibacter sp. TaxID=2320202 RepID=UPI0032B2F22D